MTISFFKQTYEYSQLSAAMRKSVIEHLRRERQLRIENNRKWQQRPEAKPRAIALALTQDHLACHSAA